MLITKLRHNLKKSNIKSLGGNEEIYRGIQDESISWDYYETGVHFFQENKSIDKKRNCANNFQYRLNFSKKNLK